MTPTDGTNGDPSTDGGTPADDGQSTDGDSGTPARRASITTSHDDPAVVAGAIEPDNTDQMATTVTADQVVTTIERPGTGGLQSTADDYLVNLQVADAVAADAATGTPEDRESPHSQTNDATDTTTNDT
jgi:hypothetical protein